MNLGGEPMNDSFQKSISGNRVTDDPTQHDGKNNEMADKNRKARTPKAKRKRLICMLLKNRNIFSHIQIVI